MKVVSVVKRTEAKTEALQVVRTLGVINVDRVLIAMLLPEIKIPDQVAKAEIQDRLAAIVRKETVLEPVRVITEVLDRATIEARQVLVEETAVVEIAAETIAGEDLAAAIATAIADPTNRTPRKIDVLHVWNHRSR
jgi:hypothetical protein